MKSFFALLLLISALTGYAQYDSCGGYPLKSGWNQEYAKQQRCDSSTQIGVASFLKTVTIGQDFGNPAGIKAGIYTTTGAFQQPKGTTTQMNALSTDSSFGSAHKGAQFFNTTTNELNTWNGSAWTVPAGGGLNLANSDLTQTDAVRIYDADVKNLGFINFNEVGFAGDKLGVVVNDANVEGTNKVEIVTSDIGQINIKTPAIQLATATVGQVFTLTNAAEGTGEWSNINESDCYGGWATYIDSAYTTGSPLVFTSSTWTTIPFSPTNIIDTYKPCDIDSFYNRTDSTFLGKLGDAYTINVSFKVRPNTPTTTLLDFGIDVDGSIGVVYPKTTLFTKGQDIEQYFISSFTVYTLGTWVANGGKPKIKTDNSVDIYDVRYEVFRVHKN